MSMAISSAYLRCSQSNTSSVNPWSAPSGITISRTGRSRLESQQAAAQTSWRCSILAVICSRLRTPRTVGEMPTAVYDCTAFAISRPPFNAVTTDDSTQGAGEESRAKSRYKGLPKRARFVLRQAQHEQLLNTVEATFCGCPLEGGHTGPPYSPITLSSSTRDHRLSSTL